ncbi:MAG: Stp1/IreP family PP2C-type Ser/Thr phosphatase [Clostridia bacterium]|nr:Stp1/IreP family PP2C-type Ser/Thr phosphatase [Clostridia bacterium]
MLYSMKTDKGLMRDVNQDCCFVTLFDKDTCFAVVCDGMGGPNAGDVASAIALKNISERFVSGWRQGISEISVKNLMTTAISAANICVYDEAHENPNFYGMGTTAVAVYISKNNAIIANVGDSRCYTVNTVLKQLTKDHSLVQQMIDNGELTETDARFYPYKNIITRAIGIEEHIEIDFVETKLEDNDKLLLCTDGLTNFVSEEEILKIINGTEIETVAGLLIDKANNNGGGDNITAVVISK